MKSQHVPTVGLSILFAALAVSFALQTPAAADSVWNGGDGDWSEDGKWTPTGAPDSETVDVQIDGGKTGTDSTVTLDIHADVLSLTIDNGDALEADNGRTLYVNGNGSTNNGTWTLHGVAGDASHTEVLFRGSQTLDGSGTLDLGANRDGYIRTGADADVITHGASHTIRGAGRILGLASGWGGMINYGTIVADGDTDHCLRIWPGSPGFTNAGTLQAVGAGGMDLRGTFTNTGQTIEVADGSRLELYGCALEGGHVAATGSHTGEIDVTFDSDLGGVTIDADTTVDQNNGQGVDVFKGLTNNGIWNLNSIGVSTAMFFRGSQTLGGAGEVVMSDNVNNAVRAGANGDVITHGANHTIRGAGHVLWGAGGMLNEGTIVADASNTLRIDPGTDGFTNTGRVEVAAGSSLASNGTLTQTAGTTHVDGELSVIVLLDIQGGVLSGTGTVNGPTHVAGTFAPGASVGTLTMEELEIQAGATYELEIEGDQSDLVHVTSDFVMDPDGPYTVNVICSGGDACLGEHDFFTWDGDDPIEFKDWGLLYQNTTITFSPGYDGDWSYDETANRMYVEITEVPEPCSLFLLGLGGVALLRRKR